MSKTTKLWATFAEQHLLGRTIVGCRYLTDKERNDLGWNRKSPVLRLDAGTLLFAASDDGGNNAGSVFGTDPQGNNLTFPVV